MKIEFDKIGTIAAFFAENTDRLYVTKLLKLFYYLDFISYKLRGSSVTNDVYFKLPYGPVPSAIKNEIDVLLPKNSLGNEFSSHLKSYIKLSSSENDSGSLVERGSKEINIRKLSNFELNLAKAIAEQFKKIRATTLSEQTHHELPWKATSDNSIISYEFANSLNVSQILPNFTNE